MTRAKIARKLRDDKMFLQDVCKEIAVAYVTLSPIEARAMRRTMEACLPTSLKMKLSDK